MQITLKSKHRKLNPAEDETIRKKLARLPRFLDQISEAELIVGTEQPHRGPDQQVVQITVRANGTLLRAEERDVELQTAVDAALDKVERRIERYKGRYERKRKGAARLATVMADEAAVAAPDDEDEETEAAPVHPVVRTKRFPVPPMTQDDAVEQMELLGHNFFIFRDADTTNLGVLYRRQDGTYGVLEPELT